MTTPVVSSTAMLSAATGAQSRAPATRAYRTKSSFVAVHFDQAGQGHIVFLPVGAILRVIGPSSCLREGFEVMFENRFYNIFEIDLLARSRLIREPIEVRTRAVAACA